MLFKLFVIIFPIEMFTHHLLDFLLKGKYMHIEPFLDAVLLCLFSFYPIKKFIVDPFSKFHDFAILAERKKAIMKSAKFSIITSNTDGIITAFNEYAESILGYSAKEVVGKTSPAIFHDPSEVEKAAKELSKEYQTEVPVGFETFVFKAKRGEFDERQYTYIHKDGSRRQVMLNVTALHGHNGELTGYMGIARDITDELTQRKLLQEQQMKLISASKMASLGEMAASIAHEVNNPLAIVVGKANLILQKEYSKEDLRDKLQKIVNAANRASKIITSLKMLSRQAGGERVEVNMCSLIRESVSILEERLKNSGVKLDVECDEFTMMANPSEIGQVIVNLVNNAADAVSKLEDKWIKIQGYEINNTAFITCTDSGEGIPQDIVDKLMTPFFTTKEFGKGTGLGLSISKQIINAHGGELYLDKTSKNTKFVVEIKK